jgi:cyclic beta-1,2-glucan synthetase
MMLPQSIKQYSRPDALAEPLSHVELASTATRVAEFELKLMSEAGRRAAAALKPANMDRSAWHTFRQRVKDERRAVYLVLKNGPRTDQNAAWITENARLLATAEKEVRDLGYTVREHPAVQGVSVGTVPRACALASAYLDVAKSKFDEDALDAFVRAFQEIVELQMRELWALKPALQFELLSRIVSGSEDTAPLLPELVSSLRHLGESDWKTIFEGLNVIEQVLGQDPAAAYSRMDYASRDLYRNSVTDLAKYSGKTEKEVAYVAVALARKAAGVPGAASERRADTGYFLLDDGLPILRAELGYRAPLIRRVQTFITSNPTAFYLIGIEALTMILVYVLLGGLERLTPVFAGFFLLLLPATQTAVHVVNTVISSLIRPRVLPKLDFSNGIPESCSTMVAVPTLLLNDSQIRDLAMDLEIRYLANRDPNLYFALLTDSPDSDRAVDERDELIEVCEGLIEELNERYGVEGRTPFYMFHRHRVFNESEDRWMGWERKRGKLLDLNQLLRGGFDSFPIKVGDTTVLPKIRYVIALDSDTQLPRDSAHRMVGAMAHPLNRAVVDPATGIVVEGYGILQPRIGVSIQSASLTSLASIYSGETGFDIYTRAVSDVYQDLFGEGIYTGKGIYDVDALHATLHRRFPENALLSHDLIEGAYARVALVTDIELIDDYPSHFSAYSRRRHRWIRGDWQILRWTLETVPDYEGRMVGNPINVISRWKILDNLRRSLFEPATLILLLSGWLYLPGQVIFWTAASLAMLLMPAYSNLLFALIRAPWGRPAFSAWAKDTLKAFARDHVIIVLNLIFLLYNALLALDAAVRSLARVFFTRRRLLEWETAAESESNNRPKSTADKYLAWSPGFAAAIGAVVYLLRPMALPVAIPILVLWLSAPLISYLLGLPSRKTEHVLDKNDTEMLRRSALRTWRFFREWSSSEREWLIPDNVREDGVAAERLSPTNLGMLLNARVAAVQFGYLTLPEFAEETRQVLEAALRLPRARGHFLNWYESRRFEPLEPLFVSTVDSGNLAASLWTLKQACLDFVREEPDENRLWHGIRDIAQLIGFIDETNGRGLRDRVLQGEHSWKQALPEMEASAQHFANEAQGEALSWAVELVSRIQQAQAWIAEPSKHRWDQELREAAAVAERLVVEMDFSFLYNARKKVLSVGYDIASQKLEPSTYDLLASESRIASFIAIAKGDAPQDSWFHLGRKHTLCWGQRVLVSWTGTMFEYLMPALWMRHYPETIMYDSMKAAVSVQRRAGRKMGTPWGISESACIVAGADEYGYAPFGVPQLAMKRMNADRIVSPYSSFLSLLVDPKAALRNLRRMEDLGWTGMYGFYEAADYSGGAEGLVRCWMAHHQGMSLLSVCNVLFDNPFQRYFHSEPYVLATERLLHERVPSAVAAEADEFVELLAMADEPAA